MSALPQPGHDPRLGIFPIAAFQPGPFSISANSIGVTKFSRLNFAYVRLQPLALGRCSVKVIATIGLGQYYSSSMTICHKSVLSVDFHSHTTAQGDSLADSKEMAATMPDE